jgi:hypothetical protein
MERTKYTKQFKTEAVRLMEKGDKTPADRSSENAVYNDYSQEREDQLSIIDSSDFFRSISRLRGDIEADEQLSEPITSGSLVFSAGLSVGYVIWIARSGTLLSSIISSLPAWRLIDPLPILSSLGDGLLEEEDGETLESIAAGEAEVEETGTHIDPPLDR